VFAADWTGAISGSKANPHLAVAAKQGQVAASGIVTLAAFPDHTAPPIWLPLRKPLVE
jgi:hypothetical protein